MPNNSYNQRVYLKQLNVSGQWNVTGVQIIPLVIMTLSQSGTEVIGSYGRVVADAGVNTIVSYGNIDGIP